MLLSSYTWRLKAQAGQANPVDEKGGAALSGATQTLVDRGSGDMGWRFSVGVSSVAIPSKTSAPTTPGGGFTIARKLRIKAYGNLDYMVLMGVGSGAVGANDVFPGNGLVLNKTASGYVQSAQKDSTYTPQQPLPVDTEVTIVTRYTAGQGAGSGYIRIDTWFTGGSGVGNAPDASSALNNVAAQTFNTASINASNTAIIEVADYIFWPGEVTDAQGRALTNDLRGTVDAPGDTSPPTMTGTMTSSGVSTSGYTLDWSGTARADNVGIVGFQHSVDGANWTDSGNVTSRSFTGKSASTVYPNYVRAYDGATPPNYSTPALLLNVTTSAPSSDTTSPNLSGSITQGAITSNSSTISWPAATDNVAVDHYEVSKDGGNTWTVVAVGTLTYTFSALTPSTTYQQRVRAKDAAGNVSAVLASSVTTPAASAGSFVTDQWINNAGSLRAGEAFTGTWYSGGAIGSTGGAATAVAGTLSSQGVATLAGLTTGAGFFLGKSSDGGVFYQAGTVA